MLSGCLSASSPSASLATLAGVIADARRAFGGLVDEPPLERGRCGDEPAAEGAGAATASMRTIEAAHGLLGTIGCGRCLSTSRAFGSVAASLSGAEPSTTATSSSVSVTTSPRMSEASRKPVPLSVRTCTSMIVPLTSCRFAERACTSAVRAATVAVETIGTISVCSRRCTT